MSKSAFKLRDFGNPAFYCWLFAFVAAGSVVLAAGTGVFVLLIEAVGWLKTGEWVSYSTNDWLLFMSGTNFAPAAHEITWLGLRDIALWLLGAPGWIVVPLIYWLLVASVAGGFVAFFGDAYNEQLVQRLEKRERL